MASALIGSLRISLSAETSAFEAGMKRSQRTAKATASSIDGAFKGVGNSLKAGVAGFVGALSVGMLTNVVKQALNFAGSLGETAAQLGVTTRELQTFRFAAQQNGATLEEADTALGKFTVSIGKAQAGSKAAKEAFAAVGVSLADLQNKSKSELIGQIADQMIRQGGAAKNAAAGYAIFGRGFLKLAPTLDMGSAAMTELAAAAEELGIVLSDEQIKKADVTADKIDALQTVLKARIAGVVADNADSIDTLAQSLSGLVGMLGTALRSYRAFVAEMNALGGALKALDPTNSKAGQAEGRLQVAVAQSQLRDLRRQQRGGSSAAERAARLRTALGAGAPVAPPPPSSPVPQFLAGGGGGGGGRRGGKDRSAEEAERKRMEALRDANDFDQQIRRANIDILQAKQSLATDAIERYQISIDTKDAERAAYASQLQYEVSSKQITAAQAELLQQKYDAKDQAERDLLIAEETERARRASAEVDMNALEMARDRLQSEEQLANTVAERRDVQLRILDNAYAIEKASLEDVIASREATDAQKEIARQRLLNLNKTYQNDRQGVMNNNRGPLGDYVAETEDMNTALEGVAVDGLQKLEDGLTGLIMGTKSLKEAFHDMAAAILEDLIRIMIRQLIVKALMSAFGGGMADGGMVGGGDTGAIGMASGGFVSGPGGPREDRVPAMLSAGEYVVNAKSTRKFLPLLKGINEGNFARLAAGGLALPRSSMGERVKLSNDNEGNGRRGTTNLFDLRGAVMTEDILRRINEMGAQAADQGGNLGVKRMRDLNERTFGRAGR